MTRKLVVLLDGTGNRIGVQPSNVLRMLPLLSKDRDKVLAHYDQGVGTFGRPGVLFEWQNLPARLLGLAFGWGTRVTVERAYRFLCQHHQPGDEIHIYGFSRGAYAARLLAATLFRVGLVAPEHVHHFPLIWQALTQRKPGFGRMGYLKSLFEARKVDVQLLGLYDTVNSTGWLLNPFQVPNTVTNPAVRHVRHALSLDERRSFFRPLLWKEDASPGDDGTPRVQQVWFAGSHSDVGGGYPLKEAGLANAALHWMLGEATALGLDLDTGAYLAFIRKKHAAANPLGHYHNSYNLLWSLTEWLPRVVWDSTLKKRRLTLGRYWPFGKHTYRPLPIAPALHHSVGARCDAMAGYRPDIALLECSWVPDRPVTINGSTPTLPARQPRKARVNSSPPAPKENSKRTCGEMEAV